MIKIGYTVIDLFCGAGGLSEGFRQSGYKIVCGIDNDPDVCKTHAHNFPESVTLEGDIREMSIDYVSNQIGYSKEEIDVIIGGFPCQGFSMAGKRWVDDPRNQLFKEFVRFVDGFQPKVFVAENVEGLVSMANGRFIKEIKESFNNIGYKVEVKVLNSADYGVPQKRKRAIFIGTKEGGVSFPLPTHGEEGKEFLTVEEAIGDLPRLHNLFGDNITSYTPSSSNLYQKYMRSLISLNDYINNMDTNNTTETNIPLYNHWTSKSRETTLERFRYIDIGENWEVLPEELQTSGKFSNLYRRLHPNEPSVTLTNIRKSMFIHPFEDRLLTVREGARIQSFPDHMVFKGGLGSQQQQIGNAVPPLLGYAIAQHILNTLL